MSTAESLGKMLAGVLATSRATPETLPSTVNCKRPRSAEVENILAAHWLPTRFLKVTLADLANHQGAVMASEPDASYLLTGPTGRGKSHAAAVWLRLWCERDAKWHQDFYADADVPIAKGNPYWRADILWIGVSGWLGELRDAYARHTEPAVTPDRAARTWAVVLDDLGGERQTDWAAETLYNVVSEREGNQLPTVVTTNLSLAELAAWHPRIASRLGGFTHIAFVGKDRRLQKGVS